MLAEYSDQNRECTRMPPTARSAERKLAAKSPRPRPNKTPFERKEQHQIKTDAIVEAAARLIHEHGVAGTSLDDVAEALGITKPSVYYYVKSKEDLILLCHLRIAKRQEFSIDKAVAHNGSGAEKIEVFIRAYAPLVWAPDSGLPRLWQDSSLSPAKRKEANRAYFRQSDRLIELIESACADGSIVAPDAEIVERALVSSILWVPIWYNEKNARYDEATLLSSLLDIFFNGLTPVSGRRRRTRG